MLSLHIVEQSSDLAVFTYATRARKIEEAHRILRCSIGHASVEPDGNIDQSLLQPLTSANCRSSRIGVRNTSWYHLGRGAPDFDNSMTLSGNID